MKWRRRKFIIKQQSLCIRFGIGSTRPTSKNIENERIYCSNCLVYRIVYFMLFLFFFFCLETFTSKMRYAHLRQLKEKTQPPTKWNWFILLSVRLLQSYRTWWYVWVRKTVQLTTMQFNAIQNHVQSLNDERKKERKKNTHTQHIIDRLFFSCFSVTRLFSIRYSELDLGDDELRYHS